MGENDMIGMLFYTWLYRALFTILFFFLLNAVIQAVMDNWFWNKHERYSEEKEDSE